MLKNLCLQLILQKQLTEKQNLVLFIVMVLISEELNVEFLVKKLNNTILIELYLLYFTKNKILNMLKNTYQSLEINL